VRTLLFDTETTGTKEARLVEAAWVQLADGAPSVVAAETPPLAHLRERFEERAAFIPDCGCWLWVGSPVFMARRVKHAQSIRNLTNGERYGRACFVGVRERYTHRLSWLIYRGPIPEGLWVLHKCDVEICVNPAHLFLGTPADNTADMMAKGRHDHNPNVCGEANPNAKLTAENVAEIRKSNLPGTVLGPMYGVTSSMIYFIRKGKNWTRQPDVDPYLVQALRSA